MCDYTMYNLFSVHSTLNGVCGENVSKRCSEVLISASPNHNFGSSVCWLLGFCCWFGLGLDLGFYLFQFFPPVVVNKSSRFSPSLSTFVIF